MVKALLRSLVSIFKVFGFILVPTMSPVNVTATASSYTSLMVEWKHVPPAYAHGVIKGYIVYYEHGNHSNATAVSDKQVPYKEYLKLSFLKIFAWYTIQVAAYTSVGVGVRSNPIYARTGEYCKLSTLVD